MELTPPDENKFSTSPTASPTNAAVVIHHHSEVKLDIDKNQSDDQKPPPQPDYHNLVPACCSGGASFLVLCCFWCILALIVPLAILLPLALNASSTTMTALYAVLITLGAVGLLWGLYSIYPLILLLTCCAPARPARVSPSKHYNATTEKINVSKLYVIVNPFGGEKKGLRILESCQKVWKEHNIEVTVLETKYAGHAKVYARTVDLKGYQALCVIGGDGSFHEMCNGYLARDDKGTLSIALGLIPGGSGNSVMHDLGTLDAIEAATRIAKGDTCFYDTIKISDDKDLSIHCVNEISMGLAGDVGVIAEDYRRCFGTARYDVLGTWFALKGYNTPTQIQVTALKGDGTDVTETRNLGGDFVTVFATITQHFGKGMRACPHAHIDDGLFDLVYLKKAKRSETLALFKLLPTGAHIGHPKVGYVQVSDAVVNFDNRKIGVINIDGEVFRFDGAIKLQIQPKQFRMFIPPDCKSLLA